MKIKIVEKEKEIQGIVKEAMIKPFGTSSHFVTNKTHRGKYAHLVIPDKPKYGWLLSDVEKEEVIKVCTKIIDKKNGRHRVYNLQTINELKEKKFKREVLFEVLEFLKESAKHKILLARIKEAYNL